MIRNWIQLLLVAVLLPAGLPAQVVTNDKSREKLFLREVKVIDEFIERFNDDPASFLRKEYKNAQRPFPYNRAELINSLFNARKSWPGDTRKDFVAQVTNTDQPQKISFTRKNWYAEAQCVFNYNKKEVKVTLVMQVLTDSNKASKWMIVKASDPTAFSAVTASPVAATAESTKGHFFISPSSSATNFLDLHQVLKADINPANFFSPEALTHPGVEKLISLLKAKKLSFNRVDEVKFHFYQIPNYVFTVEQFIRAETNSGWLINDLVHVSESDKEAMRSSLLQ